MPVETLFYRPIYSKTKKNKKNKKKLFRQFKTQWFDETLSLRHSFSVGLLLFPELSIHIRCIRLDIRADMFLFTPKHDLISSHSTLPVLLTLSRTLSPSHLSSLLSPSLLFSLLFKNTAWNFPNRKQQYM